MNRGADRQDIFTDDRDREHFEFLLGDIDDAFAVEVHAYCLMTNHVHLLLHCREGRVSEAVQHVTGNHARAYNDRHGRSGPLFGDRYKSVPVGSDEQLIATARYVHRNPLDIVPVRALSAYRWSSLGPYLGGRPGPEWLHTDRVARCMADRDHRRFVEDPLPTDLTPPQGMPRAATPSIEAVEAAVSAATGTSAPTIRRSTPGAGNPARVLTVTLAVELRASDAAVLAARYGVEPSAVRATARRGRVRLHDDPGFRRLHDRAIDILLHRGLTPL